MKRKKILFLLTPLLLAIAILLIAFEPQTRLFLGRTSVAPYPFPISPPGDLAKTIDATQKRVERDHTSGMERASLASLYVARAKQNGDASDYDKAEETAKASLKSLPFSNSGAKLVLAQVAEARHERDQG